MPEVVVSGISSGFPELSRCDGQIAHVLLTRSPLVYPRRGLTARLACVKHAASVRPEPGSNSPTKTGSKKPCTVTGSQAQSKQFKLAQHHQSEHKARHTAEFSKDTRTPTSLPAWARSGLVLRPFPTVRRAAPGGFAAVPVDDPPAW